MTEEVKVETVKETDEFAIPGLDPEATVEKGADPTTEDDNCSVLTQLRKTITAQAGLAKFNSSRGAYVAPLILILFLLI